MPPAAPAPELEVTAENADAIMREVFGGDTSRLRKNVAALAEALGLPAGLYTPASLRSGAATWHWIKHKNMSELRLGYGDHSLSDCQ